VKQTPSHSALQVRLTIATASVLLSDLVFFNL